MFTSSPLSAKNFTPVKKSHSPLRGLTASRSTTLETAANLSMSTSVDSPYQSRVKSIGKKLTNLTPTAHQNNAKADEFETKIKQIDEKITSNHAYTEDKLNSFTDAVNRIDESLAAEIVARELLEERSIKEMTLVESNVALELKKEKEQNKESERKVLSKVEGKIFAVKADFAQEQHRIDEFKEEQNQILSEQVAQLQNELKEEQSAREQVHNTIIKSISSRINKVQETLDVERKMRNETETFLFRKIEEISLSLENQVQAEKEKRERAEQQMLRLLEEACNKFEDRISSRRY